MLVLDRLGNVVVQERPDLAASTIGAVPDVERPCIYKDTLRYTEIQ